MSMKSVMFPVMTSFLIYIGDDEPSDVVRDLSPIGLSSLVYNSPRKELSFNVPEDEAHCVEDSYDTSGSFDPVPVCHSARIGLMDPVEALSLIKKHYQLLKAVVYRPPHGLIDFMAPSDVDFSGLEKNDIRVVSQC